MLTLEVKINLFNFVLGYFQSYKFAYDFNLGNFFDESDNVKYRYLRQQIEELEPIIVLLVKMH